MLEMLIAAAVMAGNWFWRGHETRGAQAFLTGYEFMADEDSKNIISIDAEMLPKPIPAEGLMRWINRDIHPNKTKNWTDEQVAAAVDRIVVVVKNGTWGYGGSRGTYRAGGASQC